MEIGTGLSILGSAIGSKDLIIKMLGPTAEYIGDGIKNFAEKRVDNVISIFKNASEKLGDKVYNKGSIPPKILKGIINEGSYADEFLCVDYFGGVLASSRTPLAHDDRGTFFNSLIARLSTYQLRTHYVFYHALKRVFNGESINWGLNEERQKLQLYFPISTFVKAMDFSDDESNNLEVYINHIINGLLREQIIDEFFIYGEKEYLQETINWVEEDGLVLQPNRLGFELFYWAYGKGQDNPHAFFNTEEKFILDKRVIIDSEIRRVKEKDKR